MSSFEKKEGKSIKWIRRKDFLVRLDFVHWLKECFTSLVKVLRKNADLLKKKKSTEVVKDMKELNLQLKVKNEVNYL